MNCVLASKRLEGKCQKCRMQNIHSTFCYVCMALSTLLYFVDRTRLYPHPTLVVHSARFRNLIFYHKMRQFRQDYPLKNIPMNIIKGQLLEKFEKAESVLKRRDVARA